MKKTNIISIVGCLLLLAIAMNTHTLVSNLSRQNTMPGFNNSQALATFFIMLLSWGLPLVGAILFLLRTEISFFALFLGVVCMHFGMRFCYVPFLGPFLPPSEIWILGVNLGVTFLCGILLSRGEV